MSRARKSVDTTRTKRGDAPSRGKPDRTYAVGYGRPPIESQFQPGTSGNPRGRRKGSKNLKTLIRKAMTASVSIHEGTKTRRVTKIEGVVLRQLQSALTGDDRSAMAVIKMAMQMGLLEEPASNAAEDTALSGADERILEELLARHSDKRR
jgi:Family of unknown function (DUF5681)